MFWIFLEIQFILKKKLDLQFPPVDNAQIILYVY